MMQSTLRSSMLACRGIGQATAGAMFNLTPPPQQSARSIAQIAARFNFLYFLVGIVPCKSGMFALTAASGARRACCLQHVAVANRVEVFGWCSAVVILAVFCRIGFQRADHFLNDSIMQPLFSVCEGIGMGKALVGT